VRTIELHAQDWNTVTDFHGALLTAIGAPAWHGRSIDAFIDSMIWGGINSIEPPYKVRVHGLQSLTINVRNEIELVRQHVTEARTEFLHSRGQDPGVFFEVVL